MSQALLDAVLHGQYQLGQALYQALEVPTAADHHLAGICETNLGNHVRAQLLLSKALAQGRKEAQVDLAILYRLRGDLALAAECLSTLSPDSLDAIEGALCLREFAIHAEHRGEYEVAAAVCERAMWRAAAAPLAVQVVVAHSAGLLATRMGRDVLADRYLSFAEQYAHQSRLPLVRAARATSLMHTGRFPEAFEVLDSIGTDVPDAIRVVVLRLKGLLHRAHGRMREARRVLLHATEQARAHGARSTECHSHLVLVSVLVSLGEVRAAEASLARGEYLARGKLDEAHLHFRRGELLHHQGALTPAIQTLGLAADLFGQAHAWRERAYVLAHLAACHSALGELDQVTVLQHEITQLCSALGNPLLLMLEAPAYRRGPSEYSAGGGTLLEVNTLGVPKVRLNGQGLQFKLSRTLEILTYLLTHPRATLMNIQRDLFPEESQQRSRNYFHQVRHDLEHQVPGVRVLYDRADQTYGLEVGGLTITWDVPVFEQLLKQTPVDLLQVIDTYGAGFLPKATGEWAELERERLQQALMLTSLKRLEEWRERGEYHHVVVLAERLLQLEPLDATLHTFRVLAFRQMHGHSAAHSVREKVIAMYRRELGEVPPSFLDATQGT